MAENTESPSLGRYILLALAFVLVFVGVAYLVYRFTQRPSGSLPQVSPTPTVTSGQSSGPSVPITRYPFVLPPPSNRPVTGRPDNTFILPKIPYRPQVVSDNRGTIAQDGRGNLLINNLTHEENFALQREALQGANQLKLAEEQTRRQLEQQRLVNQAQLENARVTNERQRDQQRLALQQQEKELQARTRQLELQSQQQLAAQAQEAALKAKEQRYALLAEKTGADIARLQQADHHLQSLELLDIQARIQANLATLTSRYGKSLAY